jgi:hypothetical protein
MRGTRLLVLLLAAMSGSVASEGPAPAQCRLCDTPSTAAAPTQQSAEVQLQIETTLNFDRLILTEQVSGEALLRPDGSTGVAGAVANVGPRAAVATVIVHGEPGRTLRIDVARRIDLYSLGGNRLTFDQVETDAPSVPRLDMAGNLTFHIGGRLRFVGTEDGDYRGDLPITVDYQ